MAKNIILCSDGTGNKGGYGADTNVFKLYNAVDIHGPKTQITYYDDGVGTNTNKYIRGVTGAFGLGFGRNIRDLYAFLSRNYDPGDEVYLIGFSRGAATVRAFAGMVQECGLLDVEGDFCKTKGEFDESKFQYYVKKAFKTYRWRNIFSQKAKNFKKSKGVLVNAEGLDCESDVPIKFIGVWDTVSALGLPQDWSWTANWFFWTLDFILDFFFPHKFYNYQLNKNVENVHHAIAIDDERKTFHPKIWNEKCKVCSLVEREYPTPEGQSRECTHNFQRPQNIEQVWFSGVHSNVGGGYPRAGLSLVALDWMLERAWKNGNGIKFKNGKLIEVKADANVYGKLYDSRDGVAIYYRYSPRNITELCKERLEGDVKIHKTVVKRMIGRNLGYAPGYIPEKINVVDTPLEGTSTLIDWVNDRKKFKGKIIFWAWTRKFLYRLFVEATLILVATSIWFWILPPAQEFPGRPITLIDLFYSGKWASGYDWLYGFLSWAARHLADILFYVLPEFIEPFIIYALLVSPEIFAFIAIFGFWLYFVREFFRDKTQESCEEARESFLDKYKEITEKKKT